jgi:DNA-binding NarL/FixJ family response regulator
MMRLARPDLLLVDLNLPDKDTFSPVQWDGFTVVEWMHHLHSNHSVPFIMLTSSKDPAHRTKAMALGAAGFFNKSEDFQGVITLIQTILGGTGPAPSTAPSH